MTYTTKDLEKTGLTGVARRQAQLAEEREQEMLEETPIVPREIANNNNNNDSMF